MSIIKVSAKLDRTDSQTPWGFRMAGGKDYYSPLIIQKVNPGSLSSKCGIKENDTITHIGGFDVSHLTHKDAQDLIIGSGNNLELKLERSSGTSHNSGNDGYFQQHQSLPWQQQPYKPTTGMIGLAPKPFQKPGAVTTITSHMSNFNIGVAPTTTTQDTEQTVDVSVNDTGEKAPPLDNNPMPTSTGDIIKMGDDGLTNENCSSKEYELSSCQLKEDTLISAENVTKSLIGGDQLDITSSDENNKKSDRNLADRSDATNVLPELGRTFAGFDSEDRPRSRSFRRLQGLLQEEDISEEDKSAEISDRTAQPSIARQTSINNKPQISAKPKVPPVMPKPFAVTNRLNSHDKEPCQSEAISLAEDSTSFNPSASPLPDPNKPHLQPESRQTKVIPPTKPKPPYKPYNTPIGLYSKQTLVEISAVGEPSVSDPTPPPEMSIKEVPSGDDIVVKAPSQRKTITINKSRVESPLSSQSVTAAAVAEVIVQSAERKQIVVKSNSVGRSAPPIAGQSSGIDVNGNKNLLESSAPIGPGDIIYGSDKPKIVLKKREQTNEKKDNMDFTLEDLGLTDAVVVGISLPGRAKECLPTADVDVVESRSQITVLPKPTQTAHQSFGAPTQHHSSGTVVWRPQIPAGERKMKIGRPGQAQKRPPMAGTRIPICTSCHTSIRGPFVTALDKTWCPEHFVCANPNCSQPLFDCGFVEEADQLYCEKDYEKYLAPRCARCSGAIVGEVVLALGLSLHPDCFTCHHCKNPIPKFLYRYHSRDFYCLKDWGALFQTKCYGCQFPIEPGDRWVEALSQNWHSECFNCSTCQINLEGQSFCAKNGKPYCKKHGAARRF